MIKARFAVVDCKLRTRNDFLAGFGIGVSWAFVTSVEAFIVNVVATETLLTRAKIRAKRRITELSRYCGRRFAECC